MKILACIKKRLVELSIFLKEVGKKISRRRNMLSLKEISTWPLEKLVEWINNPENQLKVYHLVYGDNYNLKRTKWGLFHDLSNPRMYKALVDSDAAIVEAALFLENEALVQLQHNLQNVLNNGEPGHDPGHRGRDGYRIAYMLSDPMFKKARTVEQIATVIGALYHDVATGIVHRYLDGKIVGHDEIGAALVATVLAEMGYPVLAKLAGYSIAAHKHGMSDYHYVANEFDPPLSLRRYFFPFEVWEENGVVYGIAVAGTRLSDRGSMGIMMGLRHIMAAILATLVEGATDKLGETAESVNLDEKNALAVLTPAMASDHGKTTFQHITGFLNSRHPAIGGGKVNTWNQYDPMFVTFQELIMHNVRTWEKVLEALENSSPSNNNVDRAAVWAEFKALLVRVNVGPRAEEAAEVIHTFWNKISIEDVSRWSTIIPVMSLLYDNSLEFMRNAGYKAAEDHKIGNALKQVLAEIDTQLM